MQLALAGVVSSLNGMYLQLHCSQYLMQPSNHELCKARVCLGHSHCHFSIRKTGGLVQGDLHQQQSLRPITLQAAIQTDRHIMRCQQLCFVGAGNRLEHNSTTVTPLCSQTGC